MASLVPGSIGIIDQILSASLWKENPQGIVEQAMPVVWVQKEEFKIPVWGTEHLEVDTIGARRTAGSDFQTFDLTFSTSASQVYQYGEQIPIKDEELETNDTNLLIMQAKSRAIQQRWLTLAEYLGAVQLAQVSNYGGQHTPAVKWDQATSTAITDIRTAKTAILNNSGMEANIMVFSQDAWDEFKWSAQVKDWKAITYDGTPNVNVIKQMLEVDKILVAKNHYVVGSTFTKMYSKFVALMYTAPSPGQFMQTWGYTFRHSAYPVMERYYSNEKRTWFLRYVDYFRQAIVDPKCGYIIQNVLT